MTTDSTPFTDPYVIPGTTTLKNCFGVDDPIVLERREYAATFARREELARRPIVGPFNLTRLQETHRRLFQDVYPWAGQIRTVEIRKGASQFHLAERIHTGAASVFVWLEGSQLLDPAVGDHQFLVEASDLLEKLNYLHPFREGNGRSQRAFLDQVAEVSGRRLSWRNISQREHTLASIRSFEVGSGLPFQAAMAEVMKPPMDGLSPLDASVYHVSARLSSSMQTTRTSADPDGAAAIYKRHPELDPKNRQDRDDEPDGPTGPER